MNTKPPFNIAIVIFLVFAVIGLYWLSRLGLDAGNAYLWLLMIGMVFIVVAVIAKLSHTDFWFEIPVNKTNERAILSLFLGIFIIFLFKLISIFLQKNFYSPMFMSPLASFGTGVEYQSFATLQSATSDFWTFFIGVICAAVVEEIILGFAFVAIGSLVFGYGIRTLFKWDFGGGKGNEIFDFVMAMIFSSILFMVLHVFNKTYLSSDGSWIWNMFFIAAAFRFILNILIYKFGSFGLMFGIGVHAANNAIFLGLDVFYGAIFSFPGGVLLIFVFVLFIYFAFASFKTMLKEGNTMAKDFITFN